MGALKDRENVFYVALGTQIARHRGKRGWSQEELAGRLTPPLTRAAISNIETAKQRVLAHVLVDLAQALDIGLQELVPRPVRVEATNIEKELAEKLRIPISKARVLAAKMNGQAKGDAS
jgi:transcriptional regulator with XRE-family HTH domain